MTDAPDWALRRFLVPSCALIFALPWVSFAQAPTRNDAVRFLEQASFGPNPNAVIALGNDARGFAGFIDDQFATPPLFPATGSNYMNPMDPGLCNDSGAGGGVCWIELVAPGDCQVGQSLCFRDNYSTYQLQLQFFTNALMGQDQLRQRVAFALSQILVVSQITIVPASWMVPYLQLLDRNAFGNFRNLLTDISLNPSMGEYLNMRGNKKTSVNENYAREILQLFSIGVNKLNPDGTPQRDALGNQIPTYGQDEITNFARVFTGWDLGPQIQPGILNYRDPMVVTVQGGVEVDHDTGPKALLNGVTIPAGTNAQTELNIALDNIFNNPNVGPFIGKNLIQHLVTSNPSPAYVGRVTAAFNNNGAGVRGEMKAVIKAILLDPEARSAPNDVNYGHLREPVLFITNTLRAFNVNCDPNNPTSTSDCVLSDSFLPINGPVDLRMSQDLFRSPSVFNYFPPDNVVAGTTIFGPEFAIQSTTTALARVNFIHEVVFQEMTQSDDRPLGTWLDLTFLEPSAALPDPANPSALMDELNSRLMHGSMTTAFYNIVRNAVAAMPEDDLTGRVQRAVYLIASSSQYQVER
jgi:uncharacterized protein (DUF1800 family)